MHLDLHRTGNGNGTGGTGGIGGTGESVVSQMSTSMKNNTRLSE